MSSQASETEAYSNADKDALHILPLAILPLASPGLRKTRLIKNSRFETVVEMFKDSRTGSGQIGVRDIRNQFSGDPATFEDDITIIEAMAEAPSFDVYSLRLTLRSHNLKIDESEHLQLSPEMQERLTSYMRVFTRPLIRRVFGDDSKDFATAAEIIGMFRGVDREEALKRIKQISDALGMSIEQIPAFLEDYGDIFLSLAYYRRYLDQVRPDFDSFRRWMQEGILNSHLRHQKDTLEACQLVETSFDESVTFVLRRFAAFDEISRMFWVDLSQDRYTELRKLIQSHYTCIAGVLCGLSVKMDRWREVFPNASGSPNARADFVTTEMVPGMDKIRLLETQAPPVE
jgi:hypothetical protein